MFLADAGALIDDTLWSQLQARMPIFRFHIQSAHLLHTDARSTQPPPRKLSMRAGFGYLSLASLICFATQFFSTAHIHLGHP